MTQIAVLGLVLLVVIPILARRVRRKSLRNNPLRGPFPAAKGLWKVIFVVLWTIGMIAMLNATYLWYDYRDHKPRVQQPAVGRNNAKYMRGVTVYLTGAEKHRLDLSESVSLGCIIGCFVIGGIMQWEQWRVDQKHYERPR